MLKEVIKVEPWSDRISVLIKEISEHWVHVSFE